MALSAAYKTKVVISEVIANKVQSCKGSYQGGNSDQDSQTVSK